MYGVCTMVRTSPRQSELRDPLTVFASMRLNAQWVDVQMAMQNVRMSSGKISEQKIHGMPAYYSRSVLDSGHIRERGGRTEKQKATAQM
jgi:hypothetical protein